ncbi:MAG: amidohydrolase family protein, partial [Rhizorhabdus sp.]
MGAATHEIDAEGLIVAPGFIDLHTHYDAQIHWDPYCTGAPWHGFTTVGMGNCGFGLAPCRPEMRERTMLMMENTEQVPLAAMRAGLPWTWETFPEWMDYLRKIPKGINLLMFLPVNPLLIYVMGLEESKKRPANEAERAELRRLLNEAMDAGACGFAFSQLGDVNLHRDFDGTPMPSDTMVFDEVLNLATVLRDRGEGFIQLQAENTGSELEARRREEQLARLCGRPVLHNIVMPIDRVPDFHRSAIRWLESMHEQGVPIFGQGVTNRYWVEVTMKTANLWDGIPIFLQFRLADDAEKMRLLEDAEWRGEASRCNADPNIMYTGVGPFDDMMIKEAKSERWSKYDGQRLRTIAAAENRPVMEVFFDIIRDGDLETTLVSPSIPSTDPDLMMEVLGHPLCVPGSSDGGAHVKFFQGNNYSTDMLTWIVRDEQKMSLEHFHYKMSAYQARIAGLQDRGTIEVGKAADIVIYDLAALSHNLYNYERADDLPAGEWRLVD